MQSSIEFIEKNMTLNSSVYDWLLIIEKAKEMHKQEIIDAFDSGVEDDGYIDNAEQYYQETFK